MSNTDRVRPPVPLNLADAYLVGLPAPTDDRFSQLPTYPHTPRLSPSYSHRSRSLSLLPPQLQQLPAAAAVYGANVQRPADVDVVAVHAGTDGKSIVDGAGRRTGVRPLPGRPDKLDVSVTSARSLYVYVDVLEYVRYGEWMYGLCRLRTEPNGALRDADILMDVLPKFPLTIIA